jgi:uncharacterized membrane protein
MTFSHEWLAVGAAACWALASLSAAPASAHLGAFAFTRWRMVCAALLLCSLATVQGGWTSLSDPALGNPWLLLAVSGVIGIFVGDSALFGCMNRLGPRRSGVLFATHALFSVALAWVFLGETLGGLVALGRGGANVSVAAAPALVFGHAVGIDLTRRDLQAAAKQAGRPWDMAKGFDQSAPLGALACGLPPASGAIALSVNGEQRQAGDLAQMIWNVAEIIATLSTFVTLAGGDLIFTGTPAGVGPVRPGDRLRATLAGVTPLEIGFRG